MIRITFTEEQVAQLRYERFHHPHPRVQAKMEALLLKSEGLPHKEICRIVGITANARRKETESPALSENTAAALPTM